MPKMIRQFKRFLSTKLFISIEETRTHLNPIRPMHLFRHYFISKFRAVPWPIHPTSWVSYPENIKIGIDTSPGYAPGCYIQGIGEIHIGDYSSIAANSAIISANHELLDPLKHKRGIVKIGRQCLISFGSVILPNTTIGDYTIVRPNSVVEGDFSGGYCILEGNPAKVVFKFPNEIRDRFIQLDHDHKYIGFKKV